MIVLDACAAVDIIRDTTLGKGMQVMRLKGERIIAPEFFRTEIRNSFLKYVRGGQMTKEEALENIEISEGMIELFIPLESIADETFVASCRYGHSFYDMLYVVTARRHGASVYTLDKRLMDVCRRAGVDCLHLMNLSEGNPEEA